MPYASRLGHDCSMRIGRVAACLGRSTLIRPDQIYDVLSVQINLRSPTQELRRLPTDDGLMKGNINNAFLSATKESHNLVPMLLE